jgi:hypothetical protein
MRLTRKSTLLYTALAVSLLATSAAAAKGSDLPNLSSAAASASSAATDTGKTDSAKTTGAAKTTGTDATTDAKTTGAAATTSAPGQSSKVVITGSGESDTATGAIPSITGDATATDGGALPTGLPTLSGQYKIVPASVPPTANAPFMQTSSLPEGTVFIAVGAILGFLAMSVLLWRGLVAWSLHRSVKRAAVQQNMADTKALFRTPAAPFYKYSDRDSTISLSGLGNKNRKSMRPTTAPGGASASSLFFSPTAGAAGAGMQSAGNRGSNYLPAGYYAAGASAPANAQSHVSIGQGHGPSISLSNLGPQSQGYGRARSMGPSPPDSPGLPPGAGMQSSSTLNLNRGYGGDERAPSAFLEDLFDGEGAPPFPGSHQAHRASGSQGRF